MDLFQPTTQAVTIMVQGTASHVGKSALAAALCRILAQDGYRVAPFKSWNMALNSYVTKDGGEIGRAQGEQAEAAGIDATVHMNPILVKPKGPGQAQVIVRGRVHGDVDYSVRSQKEYVEFCMKIIGESLEILRRDYEIIVLEGAGSPAEINLMDQDVANMKTALLANAPVLLVSDIDRGGALAASVGTMLLLPAEHKASVAGFIFNKFRGDKTILEPGLDMVAEKTGVPVLGVVPYLNQTGLGEEDGVALERRQSCQADNGRLQIRVIRLPHISNFTDFDALGNEDDVSLTYVDSQEMLQGADAIVLPGTKNSIRDMEYLQTFGLDDAIKRAAAAGTPVVGICGGYQMLGHTLEDPQGSESGGKKTILSGLGLLGTRTQFYAEKKVTRATALSQLPFGRDEQVQGYEIHMGQTQRETGCLPAFTLDEGTVDGAVSPCGQIWGTYLHGVFDQPGFRRAWLNTLRARRGWQPLGTGAVADRGAGFDALADTVRASLDMNAVYRLLGIPGPRKEGKPWAQC